MRIGIDARIYPTGIWRYTNNLLRELAEIDTKHEYVVFLRRENFGQYQPPNHRFVKVLANYPSYSFAEQILFSWRLWRAKLDLVHFTNFNLPVFYPGRYVVTIHDLIHMSHSTYGSSTRNWLYYFIKRMVYALVIRWVAWRAKMIIVPSRATRADLVARLHVNSNKIVVTYEGFDSSLTWHNRRESEDLIKKPYLLYVATMYPHKNHQRLIDAFRLLKTDYANLRLVLVGKVDYFSRRVKRLVEELGLAKEVLLPNFSYANGFLPDEDLHNLYKNASVYVFPSLKEGFGIPILEAQAHGVPVVVSDIASLREVGGSSVEYFNPQDTASIAKSIRRVLEDKNLREQLQKRGLENVRRFSWRKMAQETLRVYNLLLS